MPNSLQCVVAGIIVGALFYMLVALNGIRDEIKTIGNIDCHISGDDTMSSSTILDVSCLHK